MKVRLLYRDRDFDWQIIRAAVELREIAQRGWGRPEYGTVNARVSLPWNDEALIADLSLETLFEAMARKDDCIYEVSRRMILLSTNGNVEDIHYRQSVLGDCLKYPSVIKKLYQLAGQALEKQQAHYISDYTRQHPDAMLRESISMLEELLTSLQRLHTFAEEHGSSFTAEGWQQFFSMLKADLDAGYLTSVAHHLQQLKARRDNLLISAQLGEANKGADYLLHEAPRHDTNLWTRSKAWFAHRSPVYSFQVNPRDEAGAQALNELRDHGISQVAASVGQSAENVADFFEMLKVELAFYVGCVNLHEKLTRKGEPVCMPEVVVNTMPRLASKGLYDVGLALTVTSPVVGNTVQADGKELVIITGTNTGGKSTFLRSVGNAQLMMQAGMFVTAEAFHANVVSGIFTHYKRGEDSSMKSGKFDEELHRMSDIADHIKPGALLLFNESFAATNEREGSEIARQIITTLGKKHIKVFCVTHLYELAHGFYRSAKAKTLFLQAGCTAAGTPTFKMMEGEPLPTGHGEVLYKRIFGTKKV